MIVLGIESSCDETAAAVVDAEGVVLGDVVASQIREHARYGGIVPEIAARAHLRNIIPVVERALEGVPGGLGAVDAVAVTRGPGLVGALLVGVQMAKSLSWVRGVPLVGVNHLVGHLLSVFLRKPDEARELPALPYVALLASGGHTALYEVRGPEEIEQLGQTRDDAAGEAYDKIAKLLGLGYPGGPIIDRLASQGDPTAVGLPRPLSRGRGLDFSFSGLKTAVVNHVHERGRPSGDQQMADLCASFQGAVVDVLVQKSVAACERRRVSELVLTGGVAANRGLRERARQRCEAKGIRLHVPPVATCTDNAAMIAYAGACRLRAGHRDDLELNVFSRSPILGAGPGSPARRRYRSSKLP